MIRSNRPILQAVRSIFALAAFASLVACGSPAAPAASPGEGTAPATAASASATPAAGAKTTVKAFGEAQVGDTTKCPVSGEEFTVEATSPKVEHEGKTYYFCCGGCKKKFEADPAKFVKKT